MPLTTSQIKFLIWSVAALVLGLLLSWLGPVLTPFVVAAVLAYALTPVVDRLHAFCARRVPRALVVLVVELFFFLLVVGVLFLLVPVLTREWPLLREQLPALLGRLNAAVQPLLAQVGVSVHLDVASLKPVIQKYLHANWEEAMGSLLASLKLGGSVVLTVLGNVILIPVVLFYLLLDWKRLVQRVTELVPQRLLPSYESFISEADEVMGQYLRGQLVVMLILAIYYSVGLTLFGLDLALPIGVFTGLAIFVPYLGYGLGLLLALFAGLLEFSGDGGVSRVALMLAVVYGFGQLLESFWLTPRLVGERIGLHPLVVIFALLAFGQLFGFVGVLIALPASAVLLVAIRRLRQRYLDSGLYRS